jgi:hypothetical protein
MLIGANTAVYGGRADRLDLDLTDEVDDGLGRATPLQGQVELVSSMRNWFSFVPDRTWKSS